MNNEAKTSESTLSNQSVFKKPHPVIAKLKKEAIAKQCYLVSNADEEIAQEKQFHKKLRLSSRVTGAEDKLSTLDPVEDSEGNKPTL